MTAKGKVEIINVNFQCFQRCTTHFDFLATILDVLYENTKLEVT